MKRRTEAQTNLFDELIVDNFAGGGGASAGIEFAVGRPVNIAVNHDPTAILMHRTNHPHTRHYQTSVWDIDPATVCHGQRVGLAWFSPDCRHHSKAKGGKPVSKNIRGLTWVILRWALDVSPRVIMLENVEEIQSWGPLIKDAHGNEYPDSERKGETFNGFIAMMTTGIEPGHPALLEACEFLKIDPTGIQARRLIKGLGYAGEGRELVAADYGVPTIRKRFFEIFRNDGKPIVWPAPTHGRPDSPEVRAGKLKPWRAVSEVLDWTLPCPSIFASKEQIKELLGLDARRPLADNTMKRVARGVDKFVIQCAHPFIIEINHTPGAGFRGADAGKPLHTVTSHHGYGLVTPVLAVNNEHNTGGSPEEPLKTITTGGHHMLVTPVMTAIGQTGFSDDRSYAPGEPMRTVVSKNEQCVVAPVLIQYHEEQNERDSRGQRVDRPIHTVDASPRYGFSCAYLTKYFGQGVGQDIFSPAHTVTSRDREALTVAHISKFYDGGYTGAGSAASDPVGTVTAQDHNALTVTHIVKFKGTDIGQHPGTPLHTITTSSGEFGKVVTFIRKIEPGTNLYFWPEIRKLLNQYCGYSLAADEILILRICGIEYFISDIGLRMLTPPELYAASGFPEDYIINRDYLGHVYSKAKQVAKCGNAVPPALAEALVYANLPELCVKRCRNMADLNATIAV